MAERNNRLLRVIDQRIGPFIVYLLALFCKKRSLPQKIQSIAFLKTAAIGDTVLLSALVQDLKKQCPTFALTIITGQSNREIALHISGIEVRTLPMSNPWKALKKIRESQYDLMIDFDSWPFITSLLTFFSKSHYTIGFRRLGYRRHLLYDQSYDHMLDRHELDNYRSLLAILGVRCDHLPKILCEGAEKKKRIVLHPFSGGSRSDLKEWPLVKWQSLIDWLVELDYEVLLTGGRADCARLEGLKGAKNLGGKTSLFECMKLLKQSQCLVSVDTGIMHLAAALEVPVIGLHGPTLPSRWGAQGTNVCSLRPQNDCGGCIHYGFETCVRNRYCMNDLTVSQVQTALKKILII